MRHVKDLRFALSSTFNFIARDKIFRSYMRISDSLVILQSRQVSRLLELAASNIQLRLRQQYSIETPPAVFIESLSSLI